MMDVNRFDAGLCITCTDGDACQRESRPSHTLTPPHSPASLLLPSSRLLWHGMHPHPLPHPHHRPRTPRHVRCSPSLLTESPGLEGRQELRRRCLSRLVGENRAVHSPRTLPLLSAALSETFGPHRPGSVWHWCSLASLSRERV